MSKNIRSLADLTPDPGNANKGTERGAAMLEKSLQKYGAGRSILADKNGVVLAGNKTLEQAAALGLEIKTVHTQGDKLVVVVRDDLDHDDPLARELAIADNRVGQISLEWDSDVLRQMQEDGFDMGQFWTKEEFAQQFKLSREHGDKDRDTIEVPVETRCQPGDLWCLGDRHYLLCGDATDVDDVQRLVFTKKTPPSLLVTSPPYGVGKEYDANTKEDDLNAWRQLMSDWTGLWARICPFAAINLADLRVGPAGREVHTYGELERMCEAAGWSLVATRIWVKPPAWNMPYYAHSYRPVDDFEYIGFFGDKPYKERLAKDTEWRYRGTWEMASVAANKDHPAKFPVELPERCILMLTDPGDIVCDPFTGSGTTLVACEENDRVFVGSEISPYYCDLTIGRYEALTGTKAVRIDA